MKTKVCVKYFVHDCLCKQSFAFNSPPGPFKLDLFNNFSNFCLTIFKSFHLKLKKKSCKKVLQLVLLDNYFSDLFTEA